MINNILILKYFIFLLKYFIFLDICNDLFKKSLIALRNSELPLNESETPLYHERVKRMWDNAKKEISKWNRLTFDKKETQVIVPVEKYLDEVADCTNDSLVYFFEMGMQ